MTISDKKLLISQEMWRKAALENHFKFFHMEQLFDPSSVYHKLESKLDLC